MSHVAEINTQRTVVLALPASVHGLTNVRGPYGQWPLIQKVRQEIHTVREAHEAVLVEHIAVGEALEAMGVPFFMAAHPSTPSTIRDLFATGNCNMRTINSFERTHQLYPRDYATLIDNQLVLVQPGFESTCPHPDVQVVESPYATGGRIHYRAGIVFINPHPHVEKDTSVAMPLLKAGLKVFALPNAIMVGKNKKGRQTVMFDDHVDRVSGLIEASDGSLHLFVDDTVVGAIDRDTMKNPTRTLDWYRKACDAAEVTLHVMSDITTPYAMGFWQAPDGRVIVTGGEPELADALRKLVGTDGVFVTKLPIRHYPTWLQAGIHCLIGELPDWILGPPHVPVT